MQCVSLAYNGEIITTIPVLPGDTRGSMCQKAIDIISPAYPDFDQNAASSSFLRFIETEDPHVEIAGVICRNSVTNCLNSPLPAFTNNGRVFDIIAIRKSGFRIQKGQKIEFYKKI
jgi:hypothetical protein